jgi:hypothetical protein
MTPDELNQIERLVTILSLGLSVAIKNQVIEIDEAEQLLYSPFTITKLNELGINQQIIELMKVGTELEDLESLLPDELAKSLSQMETQALQLLATSSKTNPQLEKWLSQYLKTDNVPLKKEPLQLVG